MSKKSNIKAEYKDLFYNSDLLFSHNALYNFVIGARSNGKSYEAKKKVIRRYLRTGEQFILLRRRQSDIDRSLFSFFDDIGVEFPGHEFKVVGNKLMIDGEVAGWGLSLRGSSALKSVQYSRVWLIIFEEFLVSHAETLDHTTTYLPMEVELLMKFHDTVNRVRGTELSKAIPTKVLFIANAESEYNPYFIHFGIRLTKNAPDYHIDKFTYHDEETGGKFSIVVQQFIGREIQEARRRSDAGAIASTTSYGAHSMGNEFVQDSSEFLVDKLPSKLQPICNIKYNGMTVGYWYDSSGQKIYGSMKIQPTAVTYAFSYLDHSENTVLLADKGNFRLQSILSAWRKGALYYDSIQARNISGMVFMRQ